MGKKIESFIEINAPVETVWKALIKTEHWEWSLWTRLETPTYPPTSGMAGTLKASFNGDGKWTSYPFQFDIVDPSIYLLSWKGSVAGGLLFSGKHHIKLKAIDGKDGLPERTYLEHNESFGGLLPMIGVGVSVPQLEINYNKINVALKNYIEKG